MTEFKGLFPFSAVNRHCIDKLYWIQWFSLFMATSCSQLTRYDPESESRSSAPASSWWSCETKLHSARIVFFLLLLTGMMWSQLEFMPRIDQMFLNVAKRNNLLLGDTVPPLPGSCLSMQEMFPHRRSPESTHFSISWMGEWRNRAAFWIKKALSSTLQEGLTLVICMAAADARFLFPL